MRTTVLVTIFAIMLLGGCKKGGPVNFTCRVADTFTNSDVPTLMTGNATSAFSYSTTNIYVAFQITMIGPKSQNLGITWFNLDSAQAEKSLVPGTYNMPNYELSPPSGVATLYTSGLTSQYGSSTYSTGFNPNTNGPGTGGTVTITKNTGPGGVISGTFTCAVINQNPPYDTAYITQGSFTDVPVPLQ